MKSINPYLGRTWTKEYTCNEFACEVWQYLTGEDLSERLNNFLNGSGSFTVLEVPISPCIVFFNRNRNADSHVGIFYDGKLLHLSATGVQYVPVEIVAMNFRTMRFYQ